MLGLYVEEVVGVLECGECVVTATMAFDELLVLARVRVFFRAQEQHVFKEVREAFAVGGVIATADGNVHGCCGFVGARRGNQKHPKLVVQLHITVQVGVIRAFCGRLARQGNRTEGQYQRQEKSLLQAKETLGKSMDARVHTVSLCFETLMNQGVTGTFRLLIQGFLRQAGGCIGIELARGDALKNRPHHRNGLAIIREFGLEGVVNGLIHRLDFLFPGAGVGGCVVDGLQAGAGNGNVAFSVGIVFVHVPGSEVREM